MAQSEAQGVIENETQIDRRTSPQVAAGHTVPDSGGSPDNGSRQTGGVADEDIQSQTRPPLSDRSFRVRTVASSPFRVGKFVELGSRDGQVGSAGEVGAASTSTGDFASTSKPAEVPILSTLFGIAEEPVWRPKKFIRNAKYPGVSATGFYFQDHSGGFVLIHRASSKYDSFYTKAAIKELEAKYGKTKRSPKPATRRRSSDG